MKQRAFLLDISQYRGDMKKYQIVGQLLELMVTGVLTQCEKEFNPFLFSDLEEEAVVEIVDQFHNAFHDLEGLEITGLAKLSVRLFMNLRGFELSVWSASDEVYSIFITIEPVQLSRAICKLATFEGPDNPGYKGLLGRLAEVKYSMNFPRFKDIKKNLASQ